MEHHLKFLFTFRATSRIIVPNMLEADKWESRLQRRGKIWRPDGAETFSTLPRVEYFDPFSGWNLVLGGTRQAGDQGTGNTWYRGTDCSYYTMYSFYVSRDCPLLFVLFEMKATIDVRKDYINDTIDAIEAAMINWNQPSRCKTEYSSNNINVEKTRFWPRTVDLLYKKKTCFTEKSHGSNQTAPYIRWRLPFGNKRRKRHDAHRHKAKTDASFCMKFQEGVWLDPANRCVAWWRILWAMETIRTFAHFRYNNGFKECWYFLWSKTTLCSGIGVTSLTHTNTSYNVVEIVVVKLRKNCLIEWIDESGTTLLRRVVKLPNRFCGKYAHLEQVIKRWRWSDLQKEQNPFVSPLPVQKIVRILNQGDVYLSEFSLGVGEVDFMLSWQFEPSSHCPPQVRSVGVWR